jgi:hypothetical protein
MCTTGHARNPIEKWTRTAGLRTVYSGMKDGTFSYRERLQQQNGDIREME